MMYYDPSKAVTGKRPARSENKASARNLDDGWMVARSLIDGRSASGYSERYSRRNSSSADGAAGDENADRAGPPVGRVGLQDFLSGLIGSGGPDARARSLDVAESVGWHVWFVAVDHVWGEVGIIV